MKTTTAAEPTPAIRNILVMTDLSPASETALEYAAGWARALGAAIHVAHFIRPLAFALAGDAYGQLVERLWQEGREGLAAIEASDTLRGIPHTSDLDPGEILDGFGALVEARHADLAVLASAGRKGLEKVVLGSTAEAVFRSAQCPVLVLGPACRPALRARLPRLILYATDFGPAAEEALAHAVSLADRAGAKLCMLHVLPPPSGEWAPNLGDVNQAEARLRAMRPDQGSEQGTERPELLVRFGQPGEEILKAAQSRGADLIVVGARRPPKLSLYTGWATAYQVMSEAACPVLSVRER